ncbi:MAG: RNA polymerase factor sigma-54 [Pseudomonadota bacterium]
MHGLRLELRQTTQLMMTPQLQQAIKLLQMSNLELDAHLADLAEANPLIQVESGEAAPPRPDEAAAAPEASAPEALASDLLAPDVLAPDVWAPDGTAPEGSAALRPANTGEPPVTDPAAAEGSFDQAPGEGLAANLYTSAPPPPRSGTGEGAVLEPAAAALDMREALSRQVAAMRAEPAVQRAARAIVALLEDDGYLREPLTAVAERLALSLATAEAGLALVQACEPTGIGARDLAECFRLQLAERDRLDPMMARLLDNLPLLLKGDRRRLCLACGGQPEDIADMLADLRQLDPHPGHRFATAEPASRIPDVIVRRAGTGWDVTLNPDTLPRVAIDQRYALRLDAKGREIDRWIAEKRAEAHWLIRSVTKRAETILSVTREILRAQAAWIEDPAAGLRPLTLKRVAEETGLHESTVSRVASGKLVATPRGIVEMKFFFTNAVGQRDDLSAETVRQRLRALVAAEAPDAVLSDDDLVAALTAEGMPIARRTVAKYRKTLGIPSSVDRRRQKLFA